MASKQRTPRERCAGGGSSGGCGEEGELGERPRGGLTTGEPASSSSAWPSSHSSGDLAPCRCAKRAREEARWGPAGQARSRATWRPARQARGGERRRPPKAPPTRLRAAALHAVQLADEVVEAALQGGQRRSSGGECCEPRPANTWPLPPRPRARHARCATSPHLLAALLLVGQVEREQRQLGQLAGGEQLGQRGVLQHAVLRGSHQLGMWAGSACVDAPAALPSRVRGTATGAPQPAAHVPSLPRPAPRSAPTHQRDDEVLRDGQRHVARRERLRRHRHVHLPAVALHRGQLDLLGRRVAVLLGWLRKGARHTRRAGGGQAEGAQGKRAQWRRQ